MQRELSVLIVDDDEIILTILNAILERAGHTVRWARNALEAIAVIGESPPDIIFTDIYMPEADGFELINWLREQGHEIPLIAMSGTEGPLVDHLSLAGRLGAHSVLYKPITPESAEAAIAQVLAMVPAH